MLFCFAYQINDTREWATLIYLLNIRAFIYHIWISGCSKVRYKDTYDDFFKYGWNYFNKIIIFGLHANDKLGYCLVWECVFYLIIHCVFIEMLYIRWLCIIESFGMGAEAIVFPLPALCISIVAMSNLIRHPTLHFPRQKKTTTMYVIRFDRSVL